jgi:hypothetical protein
MNIVRSFLDSWQSIREILLKVAKLRRVHPLLGHY